MSCFIAPMVEAIITTTIIWTTGNANSNKKNELKSLNNMLWLSTIVLAIDHIMNGEISLSYPFLTAAIEPSGASTILYEILTTGLSISAFVTLVWASILIAKKYRTKIAKRSAHDCR